MFNRGFIVICTSAFVMAIGLGIIIPILPLYVKDFGASGLMIGLIYGSLFPSMIICSPFFGRLSDRIGKKIFLILGFGIGVLVALSYTFVTDVTGLIVVRLCNGLVAAMVLPLTMAYLGELSPKGQEGTYMGVYNATILLGGSIGPIVGGKIADLYGMKFTFYSFAASLGICFLLTLLLPRVQEGYGALIVSEKPFRKIFASSPLKGQLVFNFILAIATSGLMVFMPLLASDLHLSSTQIGILSSCFVFSAGVFQVPFGWFANRYNKVMLVMIGTLSFAMGLAYLPFATGFLLLVCLGILLGLTSAISNPAANALAVQNSREIGLGTTMGTLTTFGYLGYIFGPISAGIVMDQVNLSAAFHLISVIYIVGSGIFYFFNKDI